MCSANAGSARGARRAGAIALLAAATAWAQGSPPGGAAAAEALFREGKALLDKGQVAAACDKLGESQRLDPAVGTLGLLAYCHEKQGKAATAWTEYLKVAALARDAGQKQRERVARERAKALEKDLSTLQIRVDKPAAGLEVLRGGVVIARAEWDVAIPVDPGRVEVVARAPGRRPWRSVVDVTAALTRAAVTVPELEPETPPPPAPVESASAPRPPPPPSATPPVAPSAPPPPEQPPAASGSVRTVGWVLVGVGAAGVGVGTFFGLRAISKNKASSSHCDAQNACDAEGLSLRDGARGAATVSTVAFGVGLASAATGVVLLATSGHSAGGASRASLSAAPTAGGAAILASGRF